MKNPVLVTLAAAALLTGCIRPPDDGGPSSGRFTLEFSHVRSVSVEDWGVTPLPAGAPANAPEPKPVPVPPPTNRATVRIEGFGIVSEPWINTFAPRKGHISLSYLLSIDNGCARLATAAQQEGRSLTVEGFGSIAEAAAAIAQYYCAPPTNGGGSGGAVDGGTIDPAGTTNSSTLLAYPCPLPAEPGEPQIGGDPTERPTNCWCPPPLPQFFVRAEKVSCKLGDVTGPPTPRPSPLPPVEPQSAP